MFLLFVLGVVTFRMAWRARSETRRLRQLVDQLTQDVALLRTAATPPATTPAPANTAAPTSSATASAAPQRAPQAAAPTRTSQPAEHTSKIPAETAAPAPAPAPAPSINPAETAPSLAPRRQDSAAPSPRTPPPRWLVAAKSWLFGGNLVAKLGLLILFIGVSFLLKYTAARVTLPIELRLAGIVLADLALLAWGWGIRLRRPAISLPVQGAALAVLMLVTFGAFRVYQLIPGSLAFALLLVLTVFTCILAVLQNAMWLAIFGIAGGFATPILASSGGGSHIGLFAYYALLNAGVLGLALLRAWRPLNLLGFAFTFAIATTWGVLRYEPENYLSVQLFLLLFFAFYVSIPLAYARQQAVRLKHYVDGTLVFGTPMLAFGLQFSLVRGFEFGVAYSALALGLFYVALATVLRRSPDHNARYGLLADSFLALGIVFGTLAIPFALDGRWTSAAWALEGAGIVWIGLRQRQQLAWMFGLLVQAGAWLSFIGSTSALAPAAALDSNLWLGFILLAATAFLMATRFRAEQEQARGFPLLAGVFLVFATIWLVAGAWTEIYLRVHGPGQGSLLVGSALVAAVALYAIARRMAWKLAGAIALVVQAVAGLKLLQLSLAGWTDHYASPHVLDRPLLGAVMILAGALFSSWALRRQDDGRVSASYAAYRVTLIWSAFWWFCLLAPDLAGWLAANGTALWPGRYGSGGASLRLLDFCLYALLLATTTVLAVMLARRLRWPALRWFAAAVWPLQTVFTGLLLALLYFDPQLPGAEPWIAFAALWLAGEWLLASWPRQGWALSRGWQGVIHVVRTAGPWLMIWPVAAQLIANAISSGDQTANWNTSASWARFIPLWLMMAAIGWLMQRSRAGGWPVAPLAAWYRRRLIPLACAWSALLVALWNLTQDGAMAPLPYVPLFNPLDLSTCFAIVLLVACHRLQEPVERVRTADDVGWPASWIAPLPLAIGTLGYAWFNLALLRTVSHYLGVPYDFSSMVASQFVQAMLSLVWSITALVLMRHAARRAVRSIWIVGAVLLGVVVCKLFLVDLSNIGGVERIVSFLGVGALMVGIGYLAPFPQPEPSPQEDA